MPNARIRRGSLLIVPMLALWAGPAFAQDVDRQVLNRGAVTPTFSGSEPNHIALGVGAAYMPSYQGSDKMRFLPIPAIDIKEGPFFANLRNGIGITPIDTKRFTIGASAMFVQGYRKKDAPPGIDRLKNGLGARIFATVRAGGFIATVGGAKLVTGGAGGVIADMTVSHPIRITDRLYLTPTVGTTWADRRQNDRYFGITPAESIASGLPQFSTGAGFKDVSGALTASYRLTDHITFTATGAATSLIGNVKDSPLVVKKTAPSGIATITYRF